MAGCGGFRLEMDSASQAEKVLPVVQACFENIEAYSEEIILDDNIIEVDFEIGLDADEYDDVYCSLGEMPQKVAHAFPNYNFYCVEQTDSYGVAANSEATMKNGVFVCISGDSYGNFAKKITGHYNDDEMVFVEENIDIDEMMQTLFDEE